MSGSAQGPLSGALVVTLEQAVAAPFCSSRLADAGARVIKIERKGSGDFARAYDTAVNGESAYFAWLNRGKESVALDIKDDGDREILLNMLARADVFIQNLLPGALAKLGLDSASLRKRFPRLVTCDISGYGEDGPMRNAKAYDLLVQCESGLASVTGTPEAPGRVGVSVCDIATGMTAHAAICEALVGRAHTGKGSGVSVAMFDVMADWMAVPLLYHDYPGQSDAARWPEPHGHLSLWRVSLPRRRACRHYRSARWRMAAGFANISWAIPAWQTTRDSMTIRRA